MKTTHFYQLGWKISLLLIVIFFQSSFSKPLKNWLTVEYEAHQAEVSIQQKEWVWNEFLRMGEGSYLYIQFKQNEGFKTSTHFLNCKVFSRNLQAYFFKKGIGGSDAVIQYSPDAQLVVYKKPGIGLNANFISLPISWLQKFVLSNKKGGVCDTKGGRQIVFPPNSFQIISGDEVNVEVYEMDSKKSFVLSGFTASSNNELLESNGMFKISAFQDGKNLALKPGVQAEIRYKEDNFENPNNKTSYNTFYGQEKNNEINWKPNFSQKVSDSDAKVLAPVAKKSSSYSITYTETFFVPLAKKMQFLEPSIDAYSALNEKNYLYLVGKYGPLQVESDGKLTEIKAYNQYLKLYDPERNSIFLGLTKDQMEKLKMDETQKRIADEEKRKQEEEKRRKEEEERIENQKAINNHPISMKINQLGNINCDRFYDVENKTDVIVKLNVSEYDQIKVLTVFNDIKSVIHGTYLPADKGNVTFHNLPEGKNVVYLAAIFKGKEVKMAYISKNIQKNDIVFLQLKSYTNDQYEKILNDLIPN